MKKKILVLTSWYPNPYSPVRGAFVRDQALVLSRMSDVALLAPIVVDEKKKNDRLDDSESWGIGYENGILVSRKIVYTTPYMRFYYELWMWYYYWMVRRYFEELISVWGEPDILHAHVILPSGWAALKLGRAYNIPVVLTDHSGHFSRRFKTPSAVKLARNTLSEINATIAVSPSHEKQIHDFCPDAKTQVVGNVVDENYFLPEETSKIPPHRFRFLSIALLKSGKGIEDLIEAIRLLSDQKELDFEVVIGGDGPLRSELEKQVKEAHVSEHVRFVGLLDRSGVREWLRQSDVFVLPSHSETFSVILTEAMACGKPVIATRCGGPESIVEPETGLLVNVADPAAIASALEGFIKGRFAFDPRVIRESVIKRFGQATFLKRIGAIYDAISSV